MIAIDQIPPPREIETARVRHLPDAMKEYGDGKRQPGRDELKGYDVAKKPRWEHQWGKCAYCDRYYALEEQPTEHFRPELGEYAYWWLAWDWENLLFSCITCNGRSAKGTRFPLEAGSERLSIGEKPPGRERPILINPYLEDPGEQIWFEKDPAGRWVPTGTERGKKVVEILGLSRYGDKYTDFVRGSLEPRIQEVKDAMSRSRPAEAKKLWNTMLERFYHQEHDWRALTYSVLTHEFPESVRVTWGLDLEAPRTTARPMSPEQEHEWKLLSALPDVVRDKVYALGRRAPSPSWEDALEAILRHRSPMRMSELVVLCGSSKATVLEHLQGFMTAGQVTVSGQGQVATVAWNP